MRAKVKLDEIIEAMELYNDEYRSFFNTKTGLIITLSSEEMEAPDSDFGFEALPEWQRDMAQAAMDLEENFEDYIELPDKYEIDEHGMMVDFALSLEDKKISDALSNSLHGKGAFRRFKDNLQRYGISDKWYAFHESRLREIAQEWCEDNDLEFE